ncbi:MAG: KpsF/GutQ family sugar-phosphate isomerase [Bdellovibrionaceae bacterium]|nr:KpsF/GutQ family sugar-phosphate isomerase [Pseudobdellovibrionaceae bacterium]
MSRSSVDPIKVGLNVLDIEARAIQAMKPRLGPDFSRAVDLIVACRGKLVLTGMGKSGQIARKIASTFSSTGTTAVFLHPAESSHGDLGLIGREDVVIAVSYGGESSEFAGILGFVARRDLPLIAITGKPDSTLGRAATVVLNVQVPEEACPLGLAPTASSTATLAVGDALAMAVLSMKGFTAEEFAELHPGGSLGARLLTRVKDIMHKGEALPLVQENTPIREVLSIMTFREVRGAAGVLSPSGDLVGVITDGDIRRRLEKSQDPLMGTAKDLMNTNPRTIDQNELAERALFLMEQFGIQLLFVLDSSSSTPRKPVGVLNYQDLFRAKIR